jgi:hypothetical protein
MSIRYRPESGFVARNGGPDRLRPQDWIVWHFTHIDNLPGIITAGRLLSDSAVTPTTDVAFDSVKELRRHKLVAPDDGYPMSMASEHVPFYIAARSPMLYVVCRGHHGYSGGAGPLVHLGVVLGDIIDAGLTWCASDGNAAAGFTKFSRQVDSLGTFVDFDLLCQRQWDNTPDDRNRKSRRAAEILVREQLPLDRVSWVCCHNDATMTRVRTLLDPVGGVRNYVVKPEMYY